VGKQQYLKHAPIREALIDIQFNPLAEVDIGMIASEFSIGPAEPVSDLYQTMFEIKVAQDALPHASSFAAAIGKRIDLPAKHQVVQFRTNGFTFSRLAPYETWEEMAGAAQHAWRFFATRIAPGQINRIAIRYINVLRLPLPLDGFDAYLSSPPLIPKELPQSVSGFLTRVTYPKGEDVAMVTQSLEGEVDDGAAINIILDIDIAHECKLDRCAFTEVEAILERLRICKNDAFFAFLTDGALEMYK
jgi:uncharacterized protein (TIGR04255 family)